MWYCGDNYPDLRGRWRKQERGGKGVDTDISISVDSTTQDSDWSTIEVAWIRLQGEVHHGKCLYNVSRQQSGWLYLSFLSRLHWKCSSRHSCLLDSLKIRLCERSLQASNCDRQALCSVSAYFLNLSELRTLSGNVSGKKLVGLTKFFSQAIYSLSKK